MSDVEPRGYRVPPDHKHPTRCVENVDCEKCGTGPNAQAKARRAAMSPFERWLREGYDAGWVGPPVCSTHDGVPTSEAEDDEGMEYGEHPCIHVLRLYSSPADKAGVEANHSPSIWRATNAGMA